MLDWIGIIGIIIGIIGVALALLVGMRSKQIFQPNLIFNMGLLYTKEVVEKSIKKAPISTLIFAAKIPDNSKIAFACPYLLINEGKLPISNISLVLNYMSKYAIKNEDEIIGIIDTGPEHKGCALSSPPEMFKYRKVNIFDSMAQVCIEIPILRIEERIVIQDVIKFNKNNFCDKSAEDYGVNKRLAAKLKEIKKLCGICIVDAFINSESCPPISRRIKILWFDTNSVEELKSLILS
jgi:hypothetical protein